MATFNDEARVRYADGRRSGTSEEQESSEVAKSGGSVLFSPKDLLLL